MRRNIELRVSVDDAVGQRAYSGINFPTEQLSPLPLPLLVHIKGSGVKKQAGQRLHRAPISSVSWPGFRQASGTAAGSLMSRSNHAEGEAAVCCREAERQPCCTVAAGTTHRFT